MDQRICIKFCVKNGIKCSKTLEMLKVVYGECTVSQQSVYKWYKLFTEGREEVNDDARPGRPSTWTTNENTEAEKLLRMSAYRLAHAMQFFRIFWVWSVWQRSSFQNCWILTNKPVAWPSLRKCWMTLTTIQICLKRWLHNWWRIMGIWLWRRNQSPIVPMQAHWITKTEKSTSSSIKCQGFARCFLWISWRSASGVLTTRSYG